MQRRDVVRQGSLVAGAALLGLGRIPHHLYAGPSRKQAQDLVTLGRVGLRVTRLAQGTGFTIGAESPAEFQDLLKRIPEASVRA